ncbi:hypothetical protein GCM10023205_04350 [Yinghuangia aomiensis]|uniref:Uncharacterized protein n=1 Tax=Yinghuangia aomiensis TaxID=676205 RepID=A0ABP9GV58_9ACTN
MYPDVIVTMSTAESALVTVLHRTPALVEHLGLHGVRLDEARGNAVMHTPNRPVQERACVLVAALRIAGFGVAAPACFTPSPEQTERARQAAMVHALNVSRAALNAWDKVSDNLCGEDGRPLDDDAYWPRRAELDRVVWEQFASVFLVHGAVMLEQGRRAAAGMTGQDSREAAHYLGVLAAALEEGRQVRADGERALAALLDTEGQTRDEAAYADAVAERDAEGWHAASTWINHGDLLAYLAYLGTRTATPAPSPAMHLPRTPQPGAARTM